MNMEKNSNGSGQAPKNCSAVSGQALLEALIAIAVGGMLVGTAALVIAVMLRVGAQDRHLQAAWFQNQLALEAAASIVETNWSLGYVIISSFAPYFSVDIDDYQACTSKGIATCQLSYETCDPPLDPTPSQMSAFIEGLWETSIDDVSYYTCFNVKVAVRNSANNDAIYAFIDNVSIAPYESYYVDPSTLRLSVKTLWGASAEFETAPLHRYLTRHRNRVFRQTDWSGGASSELVPPSDPALAEPRHFFYSQSGINYSGVPGSICVTGSCP